MSPETKQDLKAGAMLAGFVAIFVGVVGGIMWLKWAAYFQRFPDASWWTFFVK